MIKTCKEVDEFWDFYRCEYGDGVLYDTIFPWVITLHFQRTFCLLVQGRSFWIQSRCMITNSRSPHLKICPHILKKSRRHHKITGAKKLTWCKFYIKNLQILDAIIKKLCCPGDLIPKICASVINYNSMSSYNVFLTDTGLELFVW